MRERGGGRVCTAGAPAGALKDLERVCTGCGEGSSEGYLRCVCVCEG